MVKDIGSLIRREDGKIIVWDRDKKEFEEVKEIPLREYDSTFIDHLIDLYNITNKFGLRKALNYQKRSIKAMFCNRAYKDDIIRFNNSPQIKVEIGDE